MSDLRARMKEAIDNAFYDSSIRPSASDVLHRLEPVLDELEKPSPEEVRLSPPRWEHVCEQVLMLVTDGVISLGRGAEVLGVDLLTMRRLRPADAGATLEAADLRGTDLEQRLCHMYRQQSKTANKFVELLDNLLASIYGADWRHLKWKEGEHEEAQVAARTICLIEESARGAGGGS